MKLYKPGHTSARTPKIAVKAAKMKALKLPKVKSAALKMPKGAKVAKGKAVKIKI